MPRPSPGCTSSRAGPTARSGSSTARPVEHLVIYTPRFAQQFHAGHRQGRWYVRPATSVGSGPQSPGFATARAAVEASSAGRWSLESLRANRGGLPLRVVTSMPGA